MLAVVESSLRTEVRKQRRAEDGPSVFIYFYSSSTKQQMREVSPAGACLAGFQYCSIEQEGL